MGNKRQTKREKDMYRLIVMLLAENPSNGQFPTTKLAAEATRVCYITFEKLFRDINKYLELSKSSGTSIESDDFRKWWDREIGE